MQLENILKKGKTFGKNFIIGATLTALTLPFFSCSKNPTESEKNDSPPLAELSSQAEILSEKTLNNISSYGNGILVFSESLEELNSVVVGDIVVGGTSSKTPQGILRKVDFISSDRKIIQTSYTTLEEVLNKGSFEIKKSLTPSEISNSKFVVGVTQKQESTEFFDFNLAIDNVVLYDLDNNLSTTDDQVIANGGLSFNSDFNFGVEINNSQLEKVVFENVTNEKSQLKITSKLSLLNIHKISTIAEYNFSPFVAAWVPTLPPLPIVVTPKLKVQVGVDGKISTNFEANVAQEAMLNAGISYSDQRWSPILDFSNSFEFSKPIFTLDDCYVNASAGSQLDLFLYGIAGPSAQIKGSLNFDLDTDRNPLWKLLGGLKANLNFSGGILGKSILNYSKQVLDYEKILLQSQTLPLVASLITTPSSGNAPLEVLLDASNSTPKESIIKYIFVFGDGSSDYTETPQNFSDGIFDGRTKHIYFNVGQFEPKIIIEDNLGNQNSLAKEIFVEPQIVEDSLIRITYKDTETNYSNPKWSPDGLRIVCVENKNGFNVLKIMNSDGSDLKEIPYVGEATAPSWSSQNKIAYNSDVWTSEIFIINPDGTNKKQLTYNNVCDWSPTFSPDGLKIAFTSMLNSDDQEIYVMNSDGTSKIQITSNIYHDYNSSWSPLDSKIAFVSNRDGNNEIYVMNSDGTNQIRYTYNSANDINPAWSPGGNKIFFATNINGDYEIYVMNSDRTNLKNITNFQFQDDKTPSISPDGKYIVFERAGDIYKMILPQEFQDPKIK